MTSLTGPSSTAALQPQTEQQPQQQPNPLESAAATEEAIFPTSTSTEDGPMVWVVQGKTDHAAYILKDTSTKKLIRWVWNNKTEWIDGSTEIKTELPKRRGRQHKPNHSQDFVYENDDHSAEVAVAKKPSSGSKKKAAKKYPVGTRVYKDFPPYGMFSGSVVAILKGKVYKVLYEDQEFEFLKQHELEPIVVESEELERLVRERDANDAAAEVAARRMATTGATSQQPAGEHTASEVSSPYHSATEETSFEPNGSPIALRPMQPVAQIRPKQIVLPRKSSLNLSSNSSSNGATAATTIATASPTNDDPMASSSLFYQAQIRPKQTILPRKGSINLVGGASTTVSDDNSAAVKATSAEEETRKRPRAALPGTAEQKKDSTENTVVEVVKLPSPPKRSRVSSPVLEQEKIITNAVEEVTKKSNVEANQDTPSQPKPTAAQPGTKTSESSVAPATEPEKLSIAVANQSSPAKETPKSQPNTGPKETLTTDASVRPRAVVTPATPRGPTTQASQKRAMDNDTKVQDAPMTEFVPAPKVTNDAASKPDPTSETDVVMEDAKDSSSKENTFTDDKGSRSTGDSTKASMTEVVSPPTTTSKPAPMEADPKDDEPKETETVNNGNIKSQVVTGITSKNISNNGIGSPRGEEAVAKPAIVPDSESKSGGGDESDKLQPVDRPGKDNMQKSAEPTISEKTLKDADAQRTAKSDQMEISDTTEQAQLDNGQPKKADESSEPTHQNDQKDLKVQKESIENAGGDEKKEGELPPGKPSRSNNPEKELLPAKASSTETAAAAATEKGGIETSKGPEINSAPNGGSTKVNAAPSKENEKPQEPKQTTTNKADAQIEGKQDEGRMSTTAPAPTKGTADMTKEAVEKDEGKPLATATASQPPGEDLPKQKTTNSGSTDEASSPPNDATKDKQNEQKADPDGVHASDVTDKVKPDSDGAKMLEATAENIATEKQSDEEGSAKGMGAPAATLGPVTRGKSNAPKPTAPSPSAEKTPPSHAAPAPIPHSTEKPSSTTTPESDKTASPSMPPLGMTPSGSFVHPSIRPAFSADGSVQSFQSAQSGGDVSLNSPQFLGLPFGNSVATPYMANVGNAAVTTPTNMTTPTNRKQHRKTQRESETFPGKLHKILENAEKLRIDNIICWEDGGQSFRVKEKKKLVRILVLQGWKVKCWDSIQRQLNHYGFKRISVGNFKGGYQHGEKLFLKGRPDLVGFIKNNRKSYNKKNQADEKDGPTDLTKFGYAMGPNGIMMPVTPATIAPAPEAATRPKSAGKATSSSPRTLPTKSVAHAFPAQVKLSPALTAAAAAVSANPAIVNGGQQPKINEQSILMEALATAARAQQLSAAPPPQHFATTTNPVSTSPNGSNSDQSPTMKSIVDAVSKHEQIMQAVHPQPTVEEAKNPGHKAADNSISRDSSEPSLVSLPPVPPSVVQKVKDGKSADSKAVGGTTNGSRKSVEGAAVVDEGAVNHVDATKVTPQNGVPTSATTATPQSLGLDFNFLKKKTAGIDAVQSYVLSPQKRSPPSSSEKQDVSPAAKKPRRKDSSGSGDETAEEDTSTDIDAATAKKSNNSHDLFGIADIMLNMSCAAGTTKLRMVSSATCCPVCGLHITALESSPVDWSRPLRHPASTPVIAAINEHVSLCHGEEPLWNVMEANIMTELTQIPPGTVLTPDLYVKMALRHSLACSHGVDDALRDTQKLRDMFVRRLGVARGFIEWSSDYFLYNRTLKNCSGNVVSGPELRRSALLVLAYLEEHIVDVAFGESLHVTQKLASALSFYRWRNAVQLVFLDPDNAWFNKDESEIGRLIVDAQEKKEALSYE